MNRFSALLVSAFLLCSGVASSAPEQPASCSAPEYHQFDFWAGDWDAFEVGKPDTIVAHARVDHILDGCVLLEDYRGANGSHGESFNIYDASRKVWHQSWVTNRGRLLVIEGRFEGGAMTLTGSDRDANNKERGPGGKERKVRGIWKPVPEGVRETAFTSIDGGKTWALWFDLIFRPHKP